MHHAGARSGAGPVPGRYRPGAAEWLDAWDGPQPQQGGAGRPGAGWHPGAGWALPGEVAVAAEPSWPARFAGRWRRHARTLGCLALAAIQLGGTLAAGRGTHGRLAPDVLALVLALAGPLVLALPGRPGAALIVSVAAASAYVALGYAFGPVLLSAAIALVVAVQAGRRLEAWLVAAAGWGSTLLLSRSGAHPLPVGSGLAVGVWVGVLLAVSDAARGRRESARVWARARAEERRRQAGEERLQVARDLQDGVAQQLSLIGARAEVALHALDAGGQSAHAQARAALVAIRRARDEAVAELRGALALLHADGAPAPHHPTPGLAGLAALVQQWDGAGLAVSVTGTAGPLPADVDRAAYRVVREALTNVSLHSAASRADVGLSRDGDQLVVTVTDPGPARHPAGQVPGAAGGRGLVTMRERVNLLGGAAVAGPPSRPGAAGWTVRVVLPVGPPGCWWPDRPDGGPAAARGTGHPAGPPAVAAGGAWAGPDDRTVELAVIRIPGGRREPVT